MCMRIAVCDDESLVLERMKASVEKMPEVQACDTFLEPEQLLEAVRSGCRYDIVIMDIEWNGKEAGIAAAEKLGRLDGEARIIYMTGYTRQYVQQIFLRPANLSGFLMKPVDAELCEEYVRMVRAAWEGAGRGVVI